MRHNELHPKDLKRLAENLCAECDLQEASGWKPLTIDMDTARRAIEGLTAAAFEIERLREELWESSRTLKSVRMELALPRVVVSTD